jgi:hypothetical protein
VIYGCEGDLYSDLLTEILEHCTIKVLCIVYSDLSGNTIAANDILPEELLDGCEAYICDGLHLHPLREVLDYHNGKRVIAL